MSSMQSALAMFSDEELIEELARRANRRDLENIKHWCHDCRNFKPWGERHHRGRELPMPDNYNPCVKEHAMNLRLPELHQDPHSGGFYLPVCSDREEP